MTEQTTDPVLDLAKQAAQIAYDHKAENVVILDVQELIVITDYFVICHGTNPRQLKAIADTIQMEFKKQGRLAKGREGRTDPNWLLVDYGSVVVHLFLEETRAFYDLEGLWGDAVQMEWQPED